MRRERVPEHLLGAQTAPTEQRGGSTHVVPPRDLPHLELVALLRSAQKPAVGAPAWSRFVNRPVGRHLAAAAHRLGLSPDQVTVVSAAVSFSGIALLALAPPSWGVGLAVALLLVLGYALDSADGQLARLQRRSSPAGEWLDHVVDSAKIVSLHLAVLLQLQRWDGLPAVWSLVPLAFAAVGTVAFFTMILNEQLRRRAGVPPTRAGGGQSVAHAVRNLPVDYGLLCCAFALLGSGTPFLVAYLFFLLGAVAHLGLALPVWRREMQQLGGGTT